jgi:cytoskeletal protein CcmA (bactofilin family)
MFTRASAAEPALPIPSKPTPSNGAQYRKGPSEGGKSVIGNDLKIIGQGLKIISEGILQIDGEIEGDVQAVEIIVGQQGKVTGMVAGNQVIIQGKVAGVICGKTVALQTSAQVEGDIHHMAFAIERGAMFDGRSRRIANESELAALMDGTA